MKKNGLLFLFIVFSVLSSLAFAEKVKDNARNNNKAAAIVPIIMGYLLDASVSELVISDAKLLACIRSELGLSNKETPTSKQLLGLTTLSCERQGLEDKNIIELSKLTNLQSLSLSENKISNIAPLASLKKLESLNLSYNYLRNITHLASLVQIQTLYLYLNEITDVSFLSSFTKLKELSIGGGTNCIANLPKLSNSVTVFGANEQTTQCGKNKISLFAVIQDGAILKVIYSKNFDTCVHLLDKENKITHTANHFCTRGVNIRSLKPVNSFTNINIGKAVKLCHGNNYNLCSDLIVIRETVSGAKLSSLYIAQTSLSIRQGGAKTIKVLGRYENGSSNDITSQANFTPADTSIISIDKGVITPLALGSTTLNASVEGIESNTVTVTVIAKPDNSKVIKNSFYDQNKHLIPADASISYDPKKFALITGSVIDKANTPVRDVTLSILDHPEYGSVKTDANGGFSLPVEGGGLLTLNYIKAGYLPLDREVDVPLENWINNDPVALSQLDTKVTAITLAEKTTQLHVSTPISDDRGTRETTLVFDNITKATITRKDGSTHELKAIDVRATEFDKPNTMPAKLPEGTAFTYASALTVDGVEAGSEVSFDKPVIIYLDNFLKFNVGEVVPVGFYNEKTGKWEAADNGVVVKLLDLDNDGKVDAVDSDNNGNANDLNNNGSTADEVAGIKDNAKYAAGKTYWRAEIPHFTTWDLNYGSGTPASSTPPSSFPPVNTGDDDKRCGAGQCCATAIARSEASDSSIDIQSQTYYEDIPLAGTDITLNYTSNRVKGYQHLIRSQVSNDNLPSGLMDITAKLAIAGKTYTKTVSASANQFVEFIWDGLDSKGKRVEGSIAGQLSIGYKYQAYYLRPPSARQSFGKGSSDFTDVKAKPITKWTNSTVTFNNPIQNQQVANGWSIENHHVYSGGTVVKGDGTQLAKQVALEEGLVAYYRFEENVNDSSGKGFNGIEHGDITYVDGIVGKSASFDGNDDYVILPTINAIWKNGFSSCAWVMFKQTNRFYERIFDLGNGRNNSNILMARQATSNDLVYQINYKESNSYERIEIKNGIINNTFQFYCSTNDDMGISTIYINGRNILSKKITAVINISRSSNYIAHSNWPENDPNFYGLIDELRFYNRALSEDEIKILYEFGSSTNSIKNNTYKIPDGSQTYLFDLDGKHLKTLETQTDKVLTTFEYNSNNQLIAIKDRFNNTTTISRNSNGIITAIKAPNGQVTKLTMDSSNNLTAVTYENASRYQFAYNTGNLMTAETEPKGNVFTHEFDAQGRITKTEDQQGGWKTFTRTGDLHTVKTATGNQRSLTAKGKTESSISPTGASRSVIYSDEEMTQTVKSCGIETVSHYQLDAKTGDKVTKDQTLKLPSGKTLTTAIERLYTFNTDKTTKTRQLNTTRNGNVTQLSTDYAQGISTTTSAEGRISKRTFDTNTLLTRQQEMTGLTPTTYAYDSKGRLTTTTTGDRQQTITYDSKGNIASLTDEAGKITRLSYDLLGRVLSSTSPTGAVQRYQYDKNGNFTIFTTATDNAHPSVFNQVNNKTSSSSPLGSETRYDYDLDRKLTQVTYPSGKSKTHHYTKGLLTRITTPQGETQLEYNCLENIIKRTVGSESIDYHYDGTLLTALAYKGILNQSITMEYNNDLRLSKLTYAGNSDTLSYDKDGLLTQRGNFTLTRDAGNGLALKVNDNTLEIQRQYNGYAELTQETSRINGNQRFELATTRNKRGKITSKTETIAGTSNTYAYRYDDDGRLSEVKKGGTIVESYQYDANGNRTDASVNQDDQVLSYKGNTYHYNVDGYLDSKTDADNKKTTYQYGINGELQKVVLPNGKVIEYSHNANHQRVAKKMNGVVVEKYLWLGLTTLLAVYDKDDNPLMRFNYADGRMPVSMLKGSKLYYLHYDQVGTLKLISDSAGNTVKQVDYDSYGNLLSNSAVGFNVPFGFAGGLYDMDTGLTRFGYRDYDALSGRWTAKDPIGFAGGDGNLYGYVLGDSVNFIDVNGLIDQPILDYLLDVPGRAFDYIGSKLGKIGGACFSVFTSFVNVIGYGDDNNTGGQFADGIFRIIDPVNGAMDQFDENPPILYSN